GELDPITELRPDAPPAFVQLVSRALTTDITERPSDIERVRASLRDALRDVEDVRWTEPLRTRFVTEGHAVERAPTPDARLPESSAPPRARKRRRGPIVGAAGPLAIGGIVPYVVVADKTVERARAPQPSPPQPAPKPPAVQPQPQPQPVPPPPIAMVKVKIV